MEYLQRKGQDLYLHVYVQPGARKTQWVGIYGDALKIRLAAPAIDGKANAALCRIIAALFNHSLHTVSVVRGQTSRRKTVCIIGSGEQYAMMNERLSKLLSNSIIDESNQSVI